MRKDEMEEEWSGAVIRPVRAEDSDGILRLYEPYIRNTAATFEYEVPTAEEFARRVRELSADYPYLVCLLDGRLAGYAYAHRAMERAAYGWNAELSVYVEQSCQHRGIGRALYAALMDILKLQHVKNVYGVVVVPNPGSDRLHGAFGFARAGTYHATGYKLGAWHDVTLYEKTIGTYAVPPEPVLSVKRIPEETVREILDRRGAEIRTENRGRSR